MESSEEGIGVLRAYDSLSEDFDSGFCFRFSPDGDSVVGDAVFDGAPTVRRGQFDRQSEGINGEEGEEEGEGEAERFHGEPFFYFFRRDFVDFAVLILVLERGEGSFVLRETAG